MRTLPTQPIERSATLERETLNEKDRSARLAFSSEAPIRDFSWLPPIVLLHEPQAADLAWLRTSGALLVNHDVDQIVGGVTEATIDPAERKGRALVRFDDDADGERAWKKVKSGSLRGVSVRFSPLESRELEEGEAWTSPGGRTFRGPVIVVDKWEPREVSLTPIPADTGVGVGRGKRKDSIMPEWLRKLLVERGVATDGLTEDQARAELERLLGEPPDPERGGTPPAVDAQGLAAVARTAQMEDRLADWISRGLSPDQARQEALSAMARSVPRGSTVQRAQQYVEVGREAGEKFADAHVAGLLQRSGFYRPQDPQWKDTEPERCSLLELAKRCAKRSWRGEGRPFRGLTDSDIVAQACRAHTTSDFSAILENVLRKTVAVSYEEAESTYDRWCKVSESYSFRSESRVIFSEAPDLKETPESMPVEEGSFSDAKQTFLTKTYARKFSISRQAIINDDLSIFEGTAAALGLAGRRLPNDLAYDQLALNSGKGPTMRDSTALFDSTAHSNEGTGGALALGTLAELRKLLRLQTGPGSDSAPLNVPGKILLVPAALETTAESLISSIVVPNVAANLSVEWIKNLQVVSDARLDSISAGAYYVLAGPAFPILELAFLSGRRYPTIEQDDTGDVLGVQWKAYLDVGVCPIDWRGGARNAGA